MIPENKISCQSDSGKLATEQRLQALSDLGLLEAQTVPIFEEATQTAAHLLEMPICILGFLEQNRYVFKSAVGLSRLGLMNKLAQTRQLPPDESICAHIVENRQVLAIDDTLADPTFAKSFLVQHYGIRAYLGVPLMDADGYCLGAIAVMDLEPRKLTIQHMKFLEIMARWSMSEFERNRLLHNQETETKTEREYNFTSTTLPTTSTPLLTTTPEPPALLQVKLDLLEQLTQELRTPLTSILGMASVVCREIYGPLTNKQKEYLEIIQTSGRHLLSLVNEISQLGTINDHSRTLNLTPVDIEMLCQQVINTLFDAAERREQQIRLSLEQGRGRTWVVDKEKVRQLLYHLIYCLIQAATNGSVIRLHVSHKSDELNLNITISHPWLGEGLVPVDHKECQLSGLIVSHHPEAAKSDSYPQQSESPIGLPQAQISELSLASSDPLAAGSQSTLTQPQSRNRSDECLRLLLSRELVELQGGQISLQGTPDSGYRYVVSLPELAATEAS